MILETFTPDTFQQHFRDVSKGVNINDADTPFTRMILNGSKTVETRNTPTLDSLIGKRVALIQTGCGKAHIVGTAVIDCRYIYHNADEFDDHAWAHQVYGGRYHIDNSPTGMKYGYGLSEVEMLLTPVPCTSRGIVIRNL